MIRDVLIAIILILLSWGSCSGQTKRYLVTPKGRRITLYEKNGHYTMAWQREGKTNTLADGFGSISESQPWYPRFIAENDHYILLRTGCGSPCWTGSFLPLHGNRKAEFIHEYIAYDLTSGYVAYIYDDDDIEILNLTTGHEKRIHPRKCSSAFPGYCIDTAYFAKDTFYYKWSSDANSDQPMGKWKKASVK